MLLLLDHLLGIMLRRLGHRRHIRMLTMRLLLGRRLLIKTTTMLLRRGHPLLTRMQTMLPLLDLLLRIRLRITHHLQALLRPKIGWLPLRTPSRQTNMTGSLPFQTLLSSLRHQPFSADMYTLLPTMRRNKRPRLVTSGVTSTLLRGQCFWTLPDRMRCRQTTFD